ncbi:two-component system OmpR family response regulator [Frigoribacterium sp. UYMn621]
MGNGEERRTAVIVEDEVDIRHLLEAILTQAGFHVIAAGNGPDGIEAVRQYNPIITTLDVNMPGMDGFEVARRIRTFSDGYIVMVTALQDEIDILEGLRAGADDYISKPFRPREVRARIEALLRRPRAIVAENPSVSTVDDAPLAPITSSALHGQARQEPISKPIVHGAVPTNAETSFTEPTPVRPTLAEKAPAEPNHAEADAVEPELEGDLLPVEDTRQGWITHNGLTLNTSSGSVQVDGHDTPLLRSEFDLLSSLLGSGRRVRTKPDLVLLLRRESFVTSHFVSDAEKRAIDVLIGSLRKKLGENTADPRWIEVVGAVGYRATHDDSI